MLSSTKVSSETDAFLEPFWVHSKVEQKVHRHPIYSLFPHIGNLPSINISHQSGTLYSYEPTLSHHYYPKSIVYGGIHT